MKATRAHSSRQLAALSTSMVLGMTPWFSATVAAPGMASEWSMSSSATTWLTMAVQLGFVAGTCASALLLLSDRLSARYLAALCAFVAAVSTALIAAPGVGPSEAIALRMVTGAALAGVYPPGIKIAAGWWKERRGTAIGILVGALTLGSAFPHIIRIATVGADWRVSIVSAAAASLGAALLFLLVVREGPYQAPSAPFDPRALGRVLRHRGVALATGGYLGHMWELYAMWSSIGLFWAYVAARYALSPRSAPVFAFVTIAAGAIGCVVAGVAADRIGRANVTIAAMAVSGSCALIIGPLVGVSLPLLVVVAIIWGVAIVADSAQFSACVTELAPPDYVGTAVTVQTSLGFLLTTITIRLIPVWSDIWGWERAYMPLALGPAAGIVAMWRLRQRANAG